MFLNFSLWMKWKGDIDPTKSVRIQNIVDQWGLTLNPVHENPVTLLVRGTYLFDMIGRSLG